MPLASNPAPPGKYRQNPHPTGAVIPQIRPLDSRAAGKVRPCQKVFQKISEPRAWSVSDPIRRTIAVLAVGRCSLPSNAICSVPPRTSADAITHAARRQWPRRLRRGTNLPGRGVLALSRGFRRWASCVVPTNDSRTRSTARHPLRRFCTKYSHEKDYKANIPTRDGAPAATC